MKQETRNKPGITKRESVYVGIVRSAFTLKRLFLTTLLVLVIPLLASCGGGGGSGNGGSNNNNGGSNNPTTYTIGGTVSGLAGSGLVLENNGGDDLTVSANGSFAFSTAIANGSSYAVTVLTQPSSPGQRCTISNGSGSVNSANITNVNITCTTNTTTNTITYTIGGSVSGLTGSGLVLQDNGIDNLSISADGSFSFSSPITDGTDYAVTIQSQPTSPNQTCTVSNASGSVSGAKVTNVNITCTTDTYTIGGSISGLTGSGLVLQDNSKDNLSISADGSFSFSSSIIDGGNYAVTAKTQPTSPNQSCAVTNGSGTVSGANITNINISCTTNTYTIGGTVSGLTGSGLILQDNSRDNLTISGNGSFTFSSPITDGTDYAVTVLTQPTSPRQICTVSNGSGTLSGTSITSVSVACKMPPTWAWKAGSDTVNATGVYSGGLTPGARGGATHWIDSSGKLWLFGGVGYDSTGTSDYLNDLWMYNPATGVWTFEGGSTTVDAAGIYSGSTLSPGARDGATGWTDSNGKLWLFGGSGYDSNGTKGDLNDLWMYDPTTGVWTFEGGSTTVAAAGVYSGSTLNPGSRDNATGWTDSNGKLWLFGGYGDDSTATSGYLNDLWMYNPATRVWTFEGGSSTADAAGVYAGSTLNPGARYNATRWTDSNGKVWLFGGYGYDSTGALGRLNDLWMYNPSTGVWTFETGSTTMDATGVYSGSTLAPGARYSATGWTDSNGKLWLFGGYGDDSIGILGYLNDLWMYDPATGVWTFEGGSSSANVAGVYSGGTLNPGARFRTTGWTDSNGKLWLFGGSGRSSTTYGYLNDLWSYDSTNGTWTFEGGSSTSDAAGVYSGSTLSPGAREYATGWTDSNGKLWLFGGSGDDSTGTSGYLNDLWMYNPTTGTWIWEKGSSTVNAAGVYSSGTLTPGARDGATGWTDSNGKLWLFGGNYIRVLSYSFNDLWMYDPATGVWTFEGGSTTVNAAGVYSGSTPTPGARDGATGWTDSNGKLWLFGGTGYDSTGASGDLNDLWRYDPATGTWTWEAGSNKTNAAGVYSGSTLTPGARYDATSWTDNSGKLWLFGGLGYDSNGTNHDLNDLWMYDPATGAWTFEGGSTTVNATGVYSGATLTPGARGYATSWTDNSGKLWLFGGFGYDSTGTYGHLNDLWMYDPATGTWTFEGGSTTVAAVGVYSGSVLTPGARDSATSWTDSNGKLWLFGGYGYDSTGTYGHLNDLWMIQP